jgi:ABC-2 type transport system ATP-binding protein
MINVNKLTKYYGDYAAIRDVTFEVPRGQIVGFLGHNGAGKTTTMRILTGYLTATSGSALIDGCDVFWNPLDVRRRIGYLPENCPLYTEMRVNEYLFFRAGIKGLSGDRRRSRIDFVLGRCWLEDVQRQVIGTLSKGYRQRVGLADALLADPPVLILDEPTAGLDPTQIRSTRALIRELGQQHTILLSTHILPEVEMTCDRVIIIHRGRVAESRLLRELEEDVARNRLTVLLDGLGDAAEVRSLPGVTSVEMEEGATGNRLHITANDVSALTPQLCALAVQRGWRIREIRPDRQTLEDIFVNITGSRSEEKEAVVEPVA